MIHIIYDIVLHLSIIVLIPFFIVKMITARKYREGIIERFGFIGREKLARLKSGPLVWVHAVSVGESKAVIPVLKLLKKRRPDVKILFSTVTTTGNRAIQKDAGSLIDALIYFPLDLSWVVRRVLDATNPALFVVVEKELWPNLLKALRVRGVPAIVVNGTISDRSFRRFKQFGIFFRDIFASIELFCGRTTDDTRKAIEAGVIPSRACSFGNLKFDLDPEAPSEERLADLKRVLGIAQTDMVIVAGSTHAGEEVQVIKAFKALRAGRPGLRLIIAPRHPERFSEVETIIKSAGLVPSRRTAPTGGDVILLDTIGELMTFYAISTLAFVGGSLVENVGGHNLLEPAFFSKPVVYGAHLTTYLSMAELLEKAGGGFRVDSEEGLTKILKTLLHDEPLAAKAGAAAKKAVEANRGAAEKTVEAVVGFLNKKGRNR
ncbi:MAG: 3-deoxy-D-manno-octulosonic acid transferase [Deltaproteobacteria bacterium]